MKRWQFLVRVVVKAALLFIMLNVVFALLNPMEAIGRFSIYNTLIPGRERLPYGENPAQSYNVSLFNIPAMFASHAIARPKADDEFRLVLIGDSATWGWLLESDQTLAAQLNVHDLRAPDGRRIIAYNLGYPIMSATKDLLLLDYALQYEPDMLVWLVTLESFPREKQLFPPLLQNNPDRVRNLSAQYQLTVDPNDPRFVETTFADQTIIGQRRALADWLRLQTYGFSWAATGIDQFIPATYTRRANDFDADISWQGLTEPQDFEGGELAFELLQAAVNLDVPLLIVNEPIFTADGENSDLRYNAWYPRWAYDAYRELLTRTAAANNWPFIDLWDALPPEVFTDSPVHINPAGTAQLAELLIPTINQRLDER
ncbi:MAG: hypothetical protein OHK0046_24150 [Anaerolineae bacterium]